MEQQEFTDYVITKIIERFPQFKELCTNKPNGIVDIDLKSKQGELTLWLTTQDKEITIGFTGKKELHDWHTHMSLFGANTPDEEIEAAIELIENIINDKEKIISSTVFGYYPTNDLDGLYKYKEKDEVIEIFYWSQL